MENKISCCGYDCKNCSMFKATIENNIEELKKIMYLGPDVSCTIESHGCMGCKSNLIGPMCKTCFIKECCKNKNIDNCAYCTEFPCNYLKNYITSSTMDTLKKLNEELLKEK